MWKSGLDFMLFKILTDYFKKTGYTPYVFFCGEIKVYPSLWSYFSHITTNLTFEWFL